VLAAGAQLVGDGDNPLVFHWFIIIHSVSLLNIAILEARFTMVYHGLPHFLRHAQVAKFFRFNSSLSS
jgi:hypothetical protein